MVGGCGMTRYRWAQWGDINAFFGLMLDNVAVMVTLVSLISLSAGKQDSFTPQFVLTHMIPGTALGVLLGDLVYTWMAFRLARRNGRSEVTAMPLGLDTPSTIGSALFVLLPALREGRAQLGLSHAEAMAYAWRVGVVVLILSGVFKVVCAPLGNTIRRWVPQAGLLGSLAAIALALIAFIPLLLEGIAAVPLVGLLSLMVILVTLVARRPLPGNIPGALAAVVLGVVFYLAGEYLGQAIGWPLVPPLKPLGASAPWDPRGLFSFLASDYAHWQIVWQSALNKLPIALPFALATIVGGIDCTESAAAAGDEYDTRTILLTEGVAAVVAGLLGGVIQTTPYIGHPAYKAMGGRAAYTLATALFVGVAGYFGWFTHLFDWLPTAAMFPILVFVGLEITAQSFRVTPARHYAALALAVLPALAAAVSIPLKSAYAGQPPINPDAEVLLLTLRCLANGFIITSLLWAAALAALLDRQLVRSAIYLGVAALFALFGIIHSPLSVERIGLPGQVYAQMLDTNPDPRLLCQSPYHWAGAYFLSAVLLVGLSLLRTKEAPGPENPPNLGDLSP
jgi:AGZA family xanthine/uracil permease-like MFS transporter